MIVHRWTSQYSLTKDSDADEALTGLNTLHKDFQLFLQLFTLGAVFLGLTSDASHKVRGHGNDSGGREHIMERGDELVFDNLDSNVIDETFQGNLLGTQESVSQGYAKGRGRMRKRNS